MFIVVRSRYVAERETLRRLGADLVVHEELESGLELATRVLRRVAMGPQDVQSFVDRALESAGHAELRRELETILAEAEGRAASGMEESGADTER